jgi:hypothetical protein
MTEITMYTVESGGHHFTRSLIEIKAFLAKNTS